MRPANEGFVNKVTPAELEGYKGTAKITALTAHDFPTAQWCMKAGVDVVLVGDSFGMVSLGLPSTREVTMEMMETAVGAVKRGLKGGDQLLVADLPYCGLRSPVESALRLQKAGAESIKIECHEEGMSAIEALTEAGIPVMSHVGLLPQEAALTGDYKMKGRDPEEGIAIKKRALESERSGAFACVLENIPAKLSKEITAALRIPTIGIGAGPECDGQILVLYDLLGIFEGFTPPFARRYAEIGRDASSAVRQYAADVRAGRFPGDKESRE